MNIEQTKFYIGKYRLSLSKSLGQNFLINEEKLDRIISCAEITEEDLVIEIGPGIGTLSLKIAEKCGRLVLIEIDPQLIPPLKEIIGDDPKVEILHQDALTLDFDDLCRKEMVENPKLNTVKVVANLPYNITTPMITKLLLSLPRCERMVFTIQKEAADRIVSITRRKEYGILSVLSQFFSSAEICDSIQPDCFLPQPTVISCIITMKRHEGIPARKEYIAFFYKVVQASFNQRRKTLMNSLGGSGLILGGKTTLEEMLKSEGISLQCRAEELSYLQFAAITDKIIDCGKSHSSIETDSGQQRS
jgi:16S rRNA (adenine1518-N6/adenine1519-N6)-dimethyltransferase